jgi:hypothetical protein
MLQVPRKPRNDPHCFSDRDAVIIYSDVRWPNENQLNTERNDWLDTWSKSFL